MISEALLVAKVNNVDHLADGGFITFDVLMPEQVQPGAIVAVRRKTGLLCQFKVSEVTPEGGVGNMLPGFPGAQPKVGDELILPPPY